MTFVYLHMLILLLFVILYSMEKNVPQKWVPHVYHDHTCQSMRSLMSERDARAPRSSFFVSIKKIINVMTCRTCIAIIFLCVNQQDHQCHGATHAHHDHFPSFGQHIFVLWRSRCWNRLGLTFACKISEFATVFKTKGLAEIFQICSVERTFLVNSWLLIISFLNCPVFNNNKFRFLLIHSYSTSYSFKFYSIFY